MALVRRPLFGCDLRLWTNFTKVNMTIHCVICHKGQLSIPKYFAHQWVHRYSPNVVFPCPFPECGRVFNRYKAFCSHKRSHKPVPGSNNSTSHSNLTSKCTVTSCPVTSSSILKLLNHLESHVRKGQRVKCPCGKVFSNRNSLRSHFQRSHRNDTFVDQELESGQMATSASTNDDDMSNFCDYFPTDLPHDINFLSDEPNVESSSVKTDDFMKSFASMLLRLQSKSYLSVASLQFVTEAIHSISEHAVDQQKKLFHDLAAKYDIPLNIKTAVETEVLNNFLYEKAVGEKGIFRSQHMRKKYYKENFNFIPPVEYELGLLKDKSVQELYNKKGESQRNILRDFEDGTVFKNNQFFTQNPDGIKIILYADAFEPCDALKAARGKHKMLGVYMSLGNLPSFCRSARDPIQLVMLVNEDTLKEFNYQQVFQPLLDDLATLHNEGINLVWEDGTNKNFKGALVGISSDNLEAHGLGGFNQSFSSSDFYCRYCYARRAQRITGDVSLCKRRTCLNYDTDAKKADEQDKSVKGVWESSIFNDLPDFHIINSLPPCSAHDIAEGILPIDLFLALKKLVKAKWFGWNYINAKVKFINGKNCTSIRKINPKMKKIVGSAAGNFRLLQIITLALIDRVKDASHKAWQMIVRLQEFTKLVSAPEISIDQTFRIDFLAEEYLSLRKSVFPSLKLKCKHHYIQHYGELTRKFGPLQRWSTIRFESKHQYFKSSLRHAPNFINPTLTLSYRHQYLQAYLQEGNLFPTSVGADNVTPFKPQLYSVEVRRALEICGPISPDIHVATSAEYHGIKYSQGEIVMLEEMEDGTIRSIVIDMILVVDNFRELVFLGLEKFLAYHDLLGIHEVLSSTNTSFVSCHMPIFKVWCCLRTKKKLVAAEGMDDLKTKIKEKFSYEEANLVLEEDGTEVDDEEILLTMAEKTLMVLNVGEEWRDRSCSSSRSSSPPTSSQDHSDSSLLSSSDTSPLRSTPLSNAMWHHVPSSTSRKKGEWSKNFKAPWNKLQPALQKKLNMSVGRETDPKMKLVKSELSEVVRMVVPELRVVDKYHGIAVFKNIAESMIADYKVLADIDEEGNVIGSGIGTIAIKLQEHNNYLNRPNKNTSLIALATSQLNSTGKRKRNPQKNKGKCGTKSWQPDHPQNEDDASLAEKKKWLQLESKKSVRDRDNNKVQEYMELTYSSQRLYLNLKEPTVEEVQREWPLLLETEYLLKHSERLILEFDRKEEFMSSLKLKKVLAVIEETVIIDKAKAIMEKDETAKEEKMKQANDAMEIVHNAKTINPIVGTILLVAYKFQELKKGRSLIFLHMEEGSTRDEIAAAPSSAAPSIVVVGRSIYEATCYYVVAEHRILSASSLASEAVTVLYCLFYIFNMAFPSQLGHTWEFLQRYFFKNNPEDGSKNPKKKVHFQNLTARVNSLLRAVMQCKLGLNSEEDDDGDELM
ncbi:Cell death activator CIDE-3 [Frankliniella fusca]|uniref:Cell death activator CIDE-3 n=1 Tax=Frankliniella fusca TaxID=407009 RepID=A0AAE1LEE3_9NEOP|nr:Cell death activator CIDE-3 [Frankliniella fusca]